MNEPTERQSETNREEIGTLYRQGFGLRTIAKMTGKASSTIKRTLQQSGTYQGKNHTTLEPDRNVNDFRQWHKENCVVFVGDTGAAVDFLEGGGALTCPMSARYIGKLVRLTVTIQPSGAAAHVALGKRTADGILHATQLNVVRLLVPQPYHHRMRVQADDHFCIAGRGTVVLSELLIEELPEPPPLPPADLLLWQSENGAHVQATRHGWRVEFPDAQSTLKITFPFDRPLSSPHAGTVHCNLQYEDGQHEDARTLQWSDQPITLRVRTHRCQGETTIELKGSAPFYALSPLTLLIRHINVTGEPGEMVQLATPPLEGAPS
jgi:hypothetical protein